MDFFATDYGLWTTDYGPRLATIEMMPEKQLLAGAAMAVITPTLGVSLCGSMLDRSAANIHDDLHARSLVLDNGNTKIALVVLDLIAARKEWLSEIKHQINSFTGIPLAHILISCTHTHSAVTPVASALPMFTGVSGRFGSILITARSVSRSTPMSRAR